MPWWCWCVVFVVVSSSRRYEIDLFRYDAMWFFSLIFFYIAITVRQSLVILTWCQSWIWICLSCLLVHLHKRLYVTSFRYHTKLHLMAAMLLSLQPRIIIPVVNASISTWEFQSVKGGWMQFCSFESSLKATINRVWSCNNQITYWSNFELSRREDCRLTICMLCGEPTLLDD